MKYKDKFIPKGLDVDLLEACVKSQETHRRIHPSCSAAELGSLEWQNFPCPTLNCKDCIVATRNFNELKSLYNTPKWWLIYEL